MSYDGQQREKLDILYVITKSNWGGAQRYVYDIATAAQEDCTVAVALGGNGMLAEKLRAMAVPVYEVVSFQRDIAITKELGVFVELYRLFRKLKPKIVHLNSSKAGGLGALAARIAGVPHVIYTSHGLPFEEDRPQWQRALIAMVTWITFILCDIVIIITEANMAKVRHMPMLGYRPQLIHLGAHEEQQLPADEARTKLLHACGDPTVPKNALWIGTVAEYTANKGLPYLIAALDLVREKHPEIVCFLIGGGELESRLRHEIVSRHLEDRVFLAGFVEHAATYLSAFDIFTLTSLKEGLPYVLLEAGAAGMPFVGSAIPGIQEVVTDMVSGIVVRPKQPKEIAAGIELLLDDPQRRISYGMALRKCIKTDFSIHIMLHKTTALYSQLLAFRIRQHNL